MSNRTGLAAEVPLLKLCQQMAAIPALAEAFKDAVFKFETFGQWADLMQFPRERKYAFRAGNRCDATGIIPAPTVRQMLEWLKWQDRVTLEPEWQLWVDNLWYSPTDPDALAQACIAVAEAIKED